MPPWVCRCLGKEWGKPSKYKNTMTKNQSRALHITKLHKIIQKRGNGVKYRSVTDLEQNGAVARGPRILEKAINYSLF